VSTFDEIRRESPSYLETTSLRPDTWDARKGARTHNPRPISAVLFYENAEGGHAGAANNAQAAFDNLLEERAALECCCTTVLFVIMMDR
jgi:prolyl oligopeptidase PreP (S9A serine peptidase family)